MKLRIILLGFYMAASLSGTAVAQTATADMKSPDGKNLGTVTLTQTPSGVLLTADINGLSAGPHGFHVHEKGACSPDFKAAGGHYNPAGKGHGINHPKGQHAGDMPNIFAQANGRAKAQVLNTIITLGSDGDSIFDGDGSAIIIHAKADSHTDKPGAGGRVACGVIKK